MLLTFKVTNFLSYKDETVLDLRPSNDKSLQKNIISCGDYSGLNSLILYGANASGKSNLFRAMTIALTIIRESSTYTIGELLPILPFKLSKTTVMQPSKFEFQFVASDGIRYIYGFSADRYKVHDEYLLRYNSQRPTRIFIRKGDTYEFNSKEKFILEQIKKRNTENKLFIATASVWNAESTKIPFDWLIHGMDTFSSFENYERKILSYYTGDQSEEYIRFATHLLNAVDPCISKISVKKVPTNPESIYPHQFDKDFPVGYFDPVEVILSRKAAAEEEFNEAPFNLLEESQGINVLFYLAAILKIVFDNGETVVIDEIDQALHPAILRFLVGLFQDKEINKKGAQLIITMHNTSLLDLHIFRKDQVYFSEKDATTSASSIYSLKTKSVRKGINLEKYYLSGQYGAIPDIHFQNTDVTKGGNNSQ